MYDSIRRFKFGYRKNITDKPLSIGPDWTIPCFIDFISYNRSSACVDFLSGVAFAGLRPCGFNLYIVGFWLFYNDFSLLGVHTGTIANSFIADLGNIVHGQVPSSSVFY